MSKNSLSLTNKTIIITGSAQGNGFVIAKSLYDAGYNLVLVDKIKFNNNILKNFNNDRILKLKFDINLKKYTNKILQSTKKKFKNVHGLVNNAGISISENSSSYQMGQWNKTINTNLSSTFFLTQLIANFMVQSKINGSIINITSLASKFGMPNNPAYVASKGGLRYLTKAMAIDYGQNNIRINNLCPGYILTNMTKKSYNNNNKRKERINRTILKRWGKPEDLVGAVLFLISDNSNYITGIDLEVDGGWTAKGL